MSECCSEKSLKNPPKNRGPYTNILIIDPNNQSGEKKKSLFLEVCVKAVSVGVSSLTRTQVQTQKIQGEF